MNGDQPQTFRDHVPALDGLRGLACWMVINAHLGHAFPLIGQVPLNNGGLGVAIFFVLSGFLITRILLHAKHHDEKLSSFYLKRFARIIPAYVVFLVTGAVLINADNLLYAATYTYNIAKVHGMMSSGDAFGVAWSLCVEEHFYLFWPMVVWYCSRNRAFAIAVLLLVASLIRPIGSAWNLWNDGYGFGEVELQVYYNTLTQIAPLAFGAVLAFTEQHWRDNRRLMIYVAIGLFIAGRNLIPMWFDEFTTGTLTTIRPALEHYERFLFAACAVCICLAGTKQVTAVLEWKPITFLGRISYGVYLYHLHVYTLMRVKNGEGSDVVALVAVGLTVLVCFVSYKYFERPVMDWARRRGA